MIKHSLLHPLFAAAGIALFVGFVTVLIWLSKAAAWLFEFWDGFGGLVIQLGLWVIAICIALFAFLRLVGFAFKVREGKGSE